MAEMGDAFPRRDLGGSAENWGRHLEQRVAGLESLIRQLTDSSANTSRQIEGNTANVSSQLTALSGVVTDLGNTVQRLDANDFVNVTSGFNLNRPSSSGAWSSWRYTGDLGTFTPRTNRLLIIGNIHGDAYTSENYICIGRFGVATGTEGAGSTSPTGAVWLTSNEAAFSGSMDQRAPAKNTAVGIINVSSGTTYTLRMAGQARDYGAGTVPSGTPNLNSITAFYMSV